MSTKTYLHAAANVAQKDIITVALTWAAGDTITLTIANVSVVIAIGTNITTAQVADTIKKLFNGEAVSDGSTVSPAAGIQSIPYFKEISASVSGSVVTFTGRRAGRPFTMTASETTAGSGTAALTSSVAATGQWHVDNIDNWSGNTLPVDLDDIVIDRGDANSGLLYNLTALAIQPSSFTFTSGFKGRVGLSEFNVDNENAQYAEYRTTHLTFANVGAIITTYNIGVGESGQSGASRIRIDPAGGQCIVNCNSCGGRPIADIPVVMFLGTDPANVANVSGSGDLAIAFYKGTSAVYATVRQAGNSSKLFVGDGVTGLASVDLLEGKRTLSSPMVALRQQGGESIVRGSASATSFVHDGGTCLWHAGNIATISIRKARFDRTGDNRVMTIANPVQLYAGAELLDPSGRTAFSAGLTINCKIEELGKLDLGAGRTIAVTALP